MSGHRLPSEEHKMTEQEKKFVCNRLLTTEARMEKLILKHFTASDFKEIYEHRIGQGLVGGKACGLLVARKLIEINLPEFKEYMIPHDSYFIGTDVFYEYLAKNNCLDLRRKQRVEMEKFKGTDELRNRILGGRFSQSVKEEFKKLLSHFKDVPLIVRSSSLLEDGYGNAFSGKYESVFCANQGNMDECLQEFEEAVRKVYGSTMNPSAIEYRRKRKLLGHDEQMALLVQKVEGIRHDDWYFPLAAGMGCSYNPYKWMENLNPDAGMLRVVVGLGTRAVQRTPGDYPRLVGLDRAQARIHATSADRHKYSQRQVDIIDLNEKKIVTKMFDQVTEKLPDWEKKYVLSRDTDAERRLAQRRVYRKIYFADCQAMVENKEFIRMMRKILKMLEEEYGSPVDIEFALEGEEGGIWKLNLYQCRPLKMTASEKFQMPEGVDDEILFDLRRTSMRRSKRQRIERIVWVDPQAYYEYPYAKKVNVGRMIGIINQYYETEDKKLMLLVPGRIGTSSPELGISVVYADISQFSAILEVAYSKAGYDPELSYGSHMFQDLVEADVFYGAISENSRTKLYQPEMLTQFPDVFPLLWPEKTEFMGMIKIFDVSDCAACLLLDAKEGRAVCRLGKKTQYKKD